MKRTERLTVGAAATALVLLLGAAACVEGQATSSDEPLRDCEWCGADEAPAELDWRTTIAGESEPGERIVVRGTVYEPDGETPASGVILYLYHTDAEGVYPRRGDETGNARRHGHLRGWLRTDARGRYEFRTIRPGNYPGRDAAAHIHVTVKRPDRPEDWVASFLFADDPQLDRDPARPNVLDPRRDEDGVWHGTRDIVLPEVPCRDDSDQAACS
ncbi:MAG: intradiol ring-cleavage dioxygenase [Gemmatimonadota bacterium]